MQKNYTIPLSAPTSKANGPRFQKARTAYDIPVDSF